ncbi:hypothetical protein H5410_063971 [Solanum commersonii]|uniref:Uncharacterized protein n=1 Tax=Solanum commersonii TaxID=4109 RepID=A0A9J5W0J7_SOLCO|nr:hypothetical protein H5410_063971 [Solanum commersonii]
MPRKPKGSSARFGPPEGESWPKIRPKGIVDGQQVRRGRENASSQCSNTRRYGAEVTHAILPGKARTTLSKRVPVPETDTGGEPATEAPVNGGRNYNGPKVAKFLVGCGLPALGQKDPMKLHCSPDWLWAFLRSLRWKAKKPPSGARAISEIPLEGLRILTLCQDLRAKGQISGRQFLWGVGLPKGNGGVQRFPRAGRRLALECKGEGSLTARPTRRAGTKVGLSDPTVPSGRAAAQRIKVTVGITVDLPKSSYRREGLAPRCRLFATWGRSMFQGVGLFAH